MEKRYLLWALPLLLLLTSVSAYEECTTMTMHGLLIDTDCDSVTDMLDNCPITANTQQEDSNRDGIGDACDLLIEEVIINPSVIVRASEFFSLNVMVINNQPGELHFLQIEVANDDLNYNVQTDVSVLAAGEARTIEFLLKVPRCAEEKQYPLRITTRYLAEGQEHIEQTTQTLKVVAGGICEAPESLFENTMIDTFFEQELDIGETTIFPFRILNLNNDAVTYHLRMEGFETWGSYRLDPDTTFTVASGHESMSFLTIELEDWAPLGQTQVTVVVSADGEEERFLINLFIREAVTANQYEQLKRALEVVLILLVFVLLIAGFIIAYKKANEEPATHQDHKYLEEIGVDTVEGRE